MTLAVLVAISLGAIPTPDRVVTRTRGGFEIRFDSVRRYRGELVLEYRDSGGDTGRLRLRKVKQIELAEGVALLVLQQGQRPPQRDPGRSQTRQKSSAGIEESSKFFAEGDKIKIGKLFYCVHRSLWRKTLSANRYLDEPADANYLVVDLTVRNLDREERYLPPLNLLDSRRREYGESSKRHRVEGAFDFLKKLNPGVSTRGRTVFDVPKGRTYYLALPAGWLSSDERVYVRLVPGTGFDPVNAEAGEKKTSPAVGTSRTSSSTGSAVQPKTMRLMGDWETKKYHLPACRFVTRIKPFDDIEFSSVAEAKKYGFYPCKHCRAPRR